jgi:uncharacterized protein (DUF2164 family)
MMRSNTATIVVSPDISKRIAGDVSMRRKGATREARMLAGTEQSVCRVRWIVDSGASHHICHSKECFENLKPIQEVKEIVFGDGQLLKATHAGVVRIVSDVLARPIRLEEVLFVPGAHCNLLSISQAAKRGTTTVFKNGVCCMYSGGMEIARVHCIGKVYKLYGGKEPKKAMHARTGDDAEIWHRRLAHLNFQDIRRLAQEDMVKGMNLTMDAIQIKQGQVCEPCVMGKQHRLPFPKKSERETVKLGLLHMDVCGPMEEPSYSGARYIATCTDDATRFTEVRFTKTKAEVKQVCMEVINLLENQTDCKVKSVHLDNGKEYVNQELGNYFKQKGIKLRNTPPYTPEQNGVAERLNRTLMEKTRSMLADAGLPKKAWAEATSTANYLRNVSPVSGRSRTPWELMHMHGVKPDISGLRVFGARTFVHIPKQLHQKLDAKSEQGHLVGFAGKAYRVLLPGGRVRVTRDVIIDETKSQSESSSERQELPECRQPEKSPESQTVPGWRSKRAKHQAERFTGVATEKKIKIPMAYGEAMSSPQAEDWRIAMEEELASHGRYGTWQLEEMPEDGRKPVKSKWVFTLKSNAAGEVEKFKARLVATHKGQGWIIGRHTQKSQEWSL